MRTALERGLDVDDALHKAGFSKKYSMAGNLEIDAVAFKGEPTPANRALFNLPND
jgi:hypothetical protein